MTADEWLTNLREQLAGMSAGRRAALAASAVGSLAFLLWIAVGLGGPEERLLFRQLDEQEAARTLEALRGEKIPYRIGDGGSAIYVPAAQVYEARIRLAGQGLPGGASPGFEIFDRSAFGVTDFVNRVNYQRALQGELARSIEQLDAVERARVQLALPERRGFVSERDRKPSASVVVRTRPGQEIASAQARAILHLVASSVEQLDAASVSLVDERGRLLGTRAGEQPESAPAGSLGHQARLERELAERVEAILEPTVGAGGVVARVSAELDWTRVERTEERFDPNSQVSRSEQLTEETSSEGGVDVAAGVPGVESRPDPAAEANRSTRTSETINYEINKIVSRSVAPAGTIQRLDVAVLVDWAPGADGALEPRDADSLAEFEELAKRAVGFSSERGDRIQVTTAPFRAIELGDGGAGWLSPEVLLLASSALRFAGVLLAVWLFARLLVRPLLEQLGRETAASLPGRVGDLETQLSVAGGEAPALATNLPGAAAQLPEAAEGGRDDAVKAVRVWLSER